MNSTFEFFAEVQDAQDTEMSDSFSNPLPKDLGTFANGRRKKQEQAYFSVKRRKLLESVLTPTVEPLRDRGRAAVFADRLEYCSGAGVSFYLESNDDELRSAHTWWRRTACRPQSAMCFSISMLGALPCAPEAAASSSASQPPPTTPPL